MHGIEQFYNSPTEITRGTCPKKGIRLVVGPNILVLFTHVISKYGHAFYFLPP